MEDCMIKTQELLWQILDTSTARTRSYVLDAIRQLSNHAKKKRKARSVCGFHFLAILANER